MADLARILIVFAFVLVMLNRKANLGIVMIIASLLLGVLYQLDAWTISEAVLAAISDQETLKLLLTLILIMFLENIMRNTMILQRLVSALNDLVRDPRWVMAVMPAFIGLLPSPGGAMFSAPMVGEVSKGMDLSPERRSFINYWYRHIWEYMFPLYPGIILASSILSVPVRDLMILQSPLTVASLLAGLPIAFWGTRNHAATSISPSSRHALVDLLVGIGPITAVIVAVLVFRVDVVIALALAVIALLAANRYGLKEILALRGAFSVSTVLLVIGVQIFKEVLVRSGAIDALPSFAAAQGIPIALVVFSLPFAVGLLTGVTLSFVGVAFPVLLGLVGNGAIDLNLVAFGFASGFAGVMLSPAHLCLVLTVKHFKADFGRVQRMLIVPELVVVAVAALLYILR